LTDDKKVEHFVSQTFLEKFLLLYSLHIICFVLESESHLFWCQETMMEK